MKNLVKIKLIKSLGSMEVSVVKKQQKYIWALIGDHWPFSELCIWSGIVEPLGFSATGPLLEVGCGVGVFPSDSVGLVFLELKYPKLPTYHTRCW